jgi:hypothetical protein
MLVDELGKVCRRFHGSSRMNERAGECGGHGIMAGPDSMLDLSTAARNNEKPFSAAALNRAGERSMGS